MKNVSFNALTTEDIFLKELIDGNAKSQSDMALKIQEAVDKCHNFMQSTCTSGNNLNSVDILCGGDFEAELEIAVRKSIEVLSTWEVQT